MECQKCGKDLSEKEFKMVAEWPFCLECFQELMNKLAKAGADTEVQDSAVEVGAETKKLRCQLCKREIEDDYYKKVGIWVFCPECHADLIVRPKSPKASQEGEDAGDLDQEGAELPSPDQAPLQIKYVNCRACGRRIPEKGSKDVNGVPYCPDCYFTLPKESPLAGQDKNIRKGKVPSRESDLKAAQGCESCGRQVPEDALQSVEGFVICQACLATDADLAVQLAQKRHQKRLKRLKEELES
jgi:hypothetical protein